MVTSGNNEHNIYQKAVKLLQKYMTCTEMEAKSHLHFYFMRINKDLLEEDHILLERSWKIFTNNSHIKISFSLILCSLEKIKALEFNCK